MSFLPAATLHTVGRHREFGLLGPLLAEPLITDIFVNGPGAVWVDRGVGLEECAGLFLEELEVRELAVHLIGLGGRHIDETTPCVDARLRDGVRVHAVLPPISPIGTLLSIRVPRVRAFSIAELDAAGFLGATDSNRVHSMVSERKNLLITGASGSGKTTFLSTLLASADSAERIVAIEDVAELWVDHPQFVSLEARQANIEGAGEITMARLVREALRMRPDRLVVGECRGAEVRDLLAALNTGHSGGGGTLHANSLEDVPARLEALGALAMMSEKAIARQAASAIEVVLHLERTATGRQLSALGALRVGRGAKLEIEAAQ